MGWTITADLAAYDAHVREFLERRPIENTVALTVLAHLTSGRAFSDELATFGWYETDQGVCGAICQTPPFELLLAEVEPTAVASLVASLRGADVEVAGVTGPPRQVDEFVRSWLAPGAPTPAPGMQERLYALETLIPPDPMPSGRARKPNDSELEVLISWFEAFHQEAHAHGPVSEELVRSRAGNGLLWVWDVDGTMVSMAGRNVTAAGVARVGPVYTPPGSRRHGYGAAVTWACTADALATGARNVVLFTDLANPTSNAIYQAIGYRPVSDRLVVQFAS